MSQTRRLAAILAADVAGYSRLMGADEEGTLERLKALRRELLDPKIAEHQGRIVKTTGDGLLVEFAQRRRCGALRGRGAARDGRAERRRAGRQPHRVSHRHQSRRRDRRGATTSSATASISRRGSKRWPSPAGSASRPRVHDQDAADRLDLAFDDLGEQQRQEHCPAGAGLPSRVRGEGLPVADVGGTGAAAARQAVDRGAAVRQYERRPGAGIFRRRHGRGDHHRALAHPLAVRHRPQFELSPTRARPSM